MELKVPASRRRKHIAISQRNQLFCSDVEEDEGENGKLHRSVLEVAAEVVEAALIQKQRQQKKQQNYYLKNPT